MRCFFVFFLLFSVLGLHSASASPRPKTCLVLAGGGALGIAHVGVINVLEREKVPVDCIVGTSMGAIVGGLYASGYSAAELEALVKDSNWADLFIERAPREDRTFEDKKDDYTFLIPFRIGIDENSELAFPRGMIRGDKIDVSFMIFALRSGHIHDFDNLPIPFRAMASNLETGDAVEIGRGNLAQAMRASMSVPAVFTPAVYPLDDLVGPENPKLQASKSRSKLPRVYLVDGGVANNLPIDVARKLGAERVIAVHLPTILKNNKELRNAVDIAGQMISVMIKQNEDRQLATLGPNDLLIQPDVSAFSATSFNQAEEIIPKGISAAEARLKEMQRFSVSKEEFSRIRTAQLRAAPPTVTLGAIEIDNQTNLADGVIRSYLTLTPGDKITIADLQRNITRLYGTGDFYTISMELVPMAEGEAKLYVEATPSGKAMAAKAETPAKGVGQGGSAAITSPAISGDSTPPVQSLLLTTTSTNQDRETLRFGLSLSDDFEGNSNYNLAIRYTHRALNSLGGTADVQAQIGANSGLFGEWYQPFDEGGKWFVAPTAVYATFNASPTTASSGVQPVEYRIRVAQAGADIGYNWNFDTQLRLGYRGGTGDAELKIGDPVAFNDENFDLSFFTASLQHDSLDNVNFPTRGYRLIGRVSDSDTSYGASDDYRQTELMATLAESWGRNSIALSSFAKLNVEDDIPIQARYLTGGLFTLSGYQQDELITDNFWLNRVIVARRVSTDGWLVSLPVHLGGSFEMGSLEKDYSDISLTPSDQIFAGSLFLGVDSFFGPVYLAYGHAEGGVGSVYFYLGRAF